MRRALIIGAGASRAAGYPLTQDLLREMAREAERTNFVNYRDAWNEWQKFLNQLPRELGVLRRSTNPEIILSLADLFEFTAEYEDNTKTIDAIRKLKESGSVNTEDLKGYFESKERDFLGLAKIGKARFLNALEEYFILRHYGDKCSDPRSRDYFAELLDPLISGDAVITFNWDSLVERVLLEKGRWLPTDGFGFSRTLLKDPGLGPRRPLSSEFLKPSDVTVLKLHGSFGWKTADNVFFLDGPHYLNGFPPLRAGGYEFSLRDNDEPESYIQTESVMAYPSFLKRLAHPILHQVWLSASDFLGRAESVEIVGYSLPSSDSAARALLLPLALRCRAGAIQTIVRDPSKETLDRWRDFLGSEAEYREEGIG